VNGPEATMSVPPMSARVAAPRGMRNLPPSPGITGISDTGAD
jgi:hypothetical protein